MKHLHVDFSQALGAIKPVNGVNNGPLTKNFSQDARPYFKEAGIPFSRLHDTEYPFGAGEFVDVHCLFKNFNDDENDPANYNFTLTDEYFKAIDECGTKIIYRLGTTIEHQPIKIHALPPKDYLKWARICEHIIRHYNEGWANGMHLGIERWEIWNEPEIPQCWSAPYETYCDFYITVVTYLKEKFPHLKFGGPTCCNVWDGAAEKFLTALTRDGQHVPLDFFSWHGYMKEPSQGTESALHLKEMLKKYGYEQVESIYDEWNYVHDWGDIPQAYSVIQSERGAAFDAGMLCALQNSPCDIATYYDAQLCMDASWDGLFAPSKQTVHGHAGIVEPKKGYYSFKAFNELRRLGTQVKADIEAGSVYVCAAAGDGEAILLANFCENDCKAERVRLHLEQGSGKPLSIYKLDKTHNLEKVGTANDDDLITVGRYSVLLLKSE